MTNVNTRIKYIVAGCALNGYKTSLENIERIVGLYQSINFLWKTIEASFKTGKNITCI